MAGAALLFSLNAEDRASPAFLRLAGAADKTAASTSRAEAGLLGANAAATKSSAGFMRAQKSAAGYGSVLGVTAGEVKKLGLAFGAFEAVKVAIDMTKEAAIFDASMTRISTVVGVSKKQVDSMRSSVLALAGKTAQAPDELATSLYHMKAIGLDNADALKATKIAAEGATIGNANLEDTTNALTSTIASGITKGQSFKDTMAQILTIVGTGDMKLQDFNESLSSGLLTILKNSGVSLKETGAALAVFGDNNIRGANAATMLRIAVQALQAPAKGGAKALEQIGLKSTDLKNAMLHGGLTGALALLKKHLDDSGNSGKKAGALLVDAFGKKANTGIGVLIGQTDRWHSKLDELDKNSANFGNRWAQTTRTAKFALSSFGAELQSVGIELVGKASPAVATVTQALAGGLRIGLNAVKAALVPFVAAWRFLSPTVTMVGHALGSVGHFLSPLAPVLKTVAGGALALWAAFKLFGAARAVVTGVTNAIGGMASRAGGALRDMSSAAATARMNIGSIAGRGGAIAGIGLVLAGATIAWQKHSEAVAASKARVDDYTAAIKADSGALGENTRDAVENTLVKDNAYRTAQKLGISQATLTDAAMGNSGALDQVNRAYGDASVKTKYWDISLRFLMSQLNNTNSELGKAKTNADDIAAANRKTGNVINWLTGVTGNTTKAVKAANGALLSGKTATDAHATATGKDAKVQQFSINAHGQLVTSMQKSGSAIDNTTAAMDRQTQASNILKNALDYLNGVNVSVEQTTDQMNIALGQLRDKSSLVKDANGKLSTSLNQNTVAGAQNRQMLLGVIQNAKDAAQAVADHARQQGATLPAAIAKGNQALAANEQKIRAAARAAGLDKGQVDDLIDSVGKLAKTHADPKITLETSAAKAALSGIMSGIADANPKMALDLYLTASARALLAGLHATQGLSAAAAGIKGGTHKATGGMVRGPGSGTSDSIPARLSNGEFVVRASQTRKHLGLLQRLNTPGFAKGGIAGNASAIAALLRGLGATKAGIAGVLGNFQIESGLSTRAYNPRENAHGWAQWEGGRLTTLQNIASKLHVGITSQKAQLAMLKHELTHGYGGTLKMLRSAKSARQAAAYFDQNFERSSGSARGARMVAAAGFLGKLGNLGAIGVSGGGKITTRTVDGKRKYVYAGQIYASKAAALNAQTRAGSTSAKDAAEAYKQRQQSMSETVKNVFGGIGQAPGSPQVDLSSVGIARVRAQVKHGRDVLVAAARDGLAKSTVLGLQKQLRGLASMANKQLSNLRLKVRGSDLTALHGALGKTVDDTRTAIGSLYADMRNAGASKWRLGQVSLKASALYAAQNRLTGAKSYQSSIADTLRGAFDPTTFGSAGDLIAGLNSAAGVNNTYKKNLTSIKSKAAGDKVLMAFANQLATSGNTASLSTLAGSTPGQLKAISKAVSGYNSSVSGASGQAVIDKYGASIATLQKNQQDQYDAIVDVVDALVTRPVSVKGVQLDQEVDKRVEHALKHAKHVKSRGRHK